jgi:cyclophilin family peptidyl-prolyl cis-trans isomerase
VRELLCSVTALLTVLLSGACAPAERPPVPSSPEPEPVAAAEPLEVTREPEPEEWAVLETEKGEIWINLFEERAPAHSENFKKLVRQGWYDGSPFHRVIPDFVAQGGGRWVEGSDRTSDVGYELAPEIRTDTRHVRGAVAAARTNDAINPGRRSSGSQFYICLAPQPELDSKYTVFGQVIHGLEVVDQLESGPPGKEGLVPEAEASTIIRAWMRPANEPGSALPDDHSGHAGHSGHQ